MAGFAGLTFLALCLPFFGALIASVIVRRFGHNAAWPLALLPALAFLHFTRFLPDIASGQVVRGGFDWVPSLGLRFSWLLDGLSLTFALLITGIPLSVSAAIGPPCTPNAFEISDDPNNRDLTWVSGRTPVTTPARSHNR